MARFSNLLVKIPTAFYDRTSLDVPIFVICIPLFGLLRTWSLVYPISECSNQKGLTVPRHWKNRRGEGLKNGNFERKPRIKRTPEAGEKAQRPSSVPGSVPDADLELWAILKGKSKPVARGSPSAS
ncbi:hypothetical protein L1887_35433 [Cichorium endivia]|nr:hypothetical protein L1887_35433 [Cichorium endivia]